MAKRRKETEIKKHVTTRQLNRKEREKKTQRLIIIISVVILAIAVGFAVYGIYDSKIKPYSETVMEVNGQKVDMNYYLVMLRAYLMGAEANQVEAIANAAPDAIANNIIMIEHAPDLGFTISEEEIDNALKNGKFPDEPAYRDLYAAGYLSDKLRNEYFGAKIPEKADQVKVMAMVMDTEEMANSILDSLSKGQPFFDSVKKYGVEPISNENSGNLGWLVKGLTARIQGYTDPTVLENTAFSMKPGTVSQPVYDPNVIKNSGYWILKVTEKDGTDSCRAYGILLGSKAESEEVMQRLDKGEDFSSLAKVYSQDEKSKNDGGDMGWLKKGYTSLVMEEAFNMDIGEVKGPLHDSTVQTKGGYWIIQSIENVPDRPLDTDVRDRLIDTDMLSWLTEQKAASTIDKYLTVEQQKWAINQVTKEIDIKGK